MFFLNLTRFNSLTHIFIYLSFSVLISCGGGGQNDNPEGGDALIIDVQVSQEIYPLQWVVIDASNSYVEGDQSNPVGIDFQWNQKGGAAVKFSESSSINAPRIKFLAPEDSQNDQLVFELEVSSGELVEREEIVIAVKGCEGESGAIWSGCFGQSFGPFSAFVQAQSGESFIHSDPEGDFHVQWNASFSNSLDGIFEVTWNANDPNHENDLNGWFGIAANATGDLAFVDLSPYSQGEISFDMKMQHSDDPENTTPFIFKMECEWPCASAEMAISNAHNSYEWKQYKFSIAQLISSGLDITHVTFPFVIQPEWFAQNQQVSVQIKNIMLSEVYTPGEQMEGCPKAGNVTYSLERQSNPTADQLDAYQRITAAMDEAVWQYNCYTNLQKNIFVQYNPLVATADGHINGTIRFGSRGSMHHVTAMHEISHVMGVGFDKFKGLIFDGVFTGENATAVAREISGNPSEQIRSDGTHFWPHGLNYIEEGSTPQDLINHCRVVEAIVEDIN